MTCVVGLAHNGRVWLGGDSAASDEEGQVVTYESHKVFRRGALLIGAVESFRMRDLLQHQLEVPRMRRGQTLEDFMFSTLIEQIRRTFVFHGFQLEAEEEDGAEDAMPSGAILLGLHGRLFAVDWDYHIGEVRDHFIAIGSGGPYALGSLHITQQLGDFTPRARVLNALKVAEHYCGNVRAPFRIVSGK